MGHSGCQVEGCERPHKSQGYCNSHYKQFQRTGVVKPLIKRDFTHGPLCSVEGCGKPHKAQGYCHTHYKRWERHGSPGAVHQPWGLSK